MTERWWGEPHTYTHIHTEQTDRGDEVNTHNEQHRDNEPTQQELVAFVSTESVMSQLFRSRSMGDTRLTTHQRLSQMKLAGVFISKVASELMSLDLDEQGRHLATGEYADTHTLSLVSLMLDAEAEIGTAFTDDEIDRMPPADAERATNDRQRQRNFAYSTYLRLFSS